MGITAYLPVYWLIALVVFLVIEAATLGLATIWFAGGALVALIAAMCGAGIVIQIVLFLVVSLVLLFFTRPFAVRFLNKDTLKTNVDRVVGMEGVVTEENLQSCGNRKGFAWRKYLDRADRKRRRHDSRGHCCCSAPCGRRQADCKGQRKRRRK